MAEGVNSLSQLLQQVSELGASKAELLKKRAFAQDPAMVREINGEILKINQALSQAHGVYQSLKIKDEIMVLSSRLTSVESCTAAS